MQGLSSKQIGLRDQEGCGGNLRQCGPASGFTGFGVMNARGLEREEPCPNRRPGMADVHVRSSLQAVEAGQQSNPLDMGGVSEPGANRAQQMNGLSVGHMSPNLLTEPFYVVFQIRQPFPGAAVQTDRIFFQPQPEAAADACRGSLKKLVSKIVKPFLQNRISDDVGSPLP